MMSFLKKPIFQVDGITLTVGLGILIVLVIWFLRSRRKAG
jgi:hypothetical protein